MDSKLEKHLHIIHPGISGPTGEHFLEDVINKIAAMRDAGVSIYFHSFDVLKTHHELISNYCKKVYYYKPAKGHEAFSLNLPFLVAANRSDSLIRNLLQDDHPILMEGISSTFITTDERFGSRKMLLNLHEASYQNNKPFLSVQTSLLRRILMSYEQYLLKKHEQRLIKQVQIISSAPIIQQYNIGHSDWQPLYIPAFSSYQQVRSIAGNGYYCLFYGDLSFPGIEEAALHLLHEVFYHNKIPFVIAGNNPSKRLKRAAEEFSHTCIVENPDEKSLHDMICKAQLHVVPTMAGGDTELKLLKILFNGRHCIVTSNVKIDQKILAHCTVATTVHELKELIQQLYTLPFTNQLLLQRSALLESQFDHQKNVEAILTLLW